MYLGGAWRVVSFVRQRTGDAIRCRSIRADRCLVLSLWDLHKTKLPIPPPQHPSCNDTILLYPTRYGSIYVHIECNFFLDPSKEHQQATSKALGTLDSDEAESLKRRHPLEDRPNKGFSLPHELIRTWNNWHCY